ncbi:hypothetical protein NFI96_007109 [Prochilodus magdalenae]|nr:hypothetical protein NFI96_007109 [Prochilodus magdalenae]
MSQEVAVFTDNRTVYSSTVSRPSSSLCIEELCFKRDELNKQIQLEETEKTRLERDISVLTEKLSRVNESLAQRLTARAEFDRTIAETEAAYMKGLPGLSTPPTSPFMYIRRVCTPSSVFEEFGHFREVIRDAQTRRERERQRTPSMATVEPVKRDFLSGFCLILRWPNQSQTVSFKHMETDRQKNGRWTLQDGQ